VNYLVDYHTCLQTLVPLFDNKLFLSHFYWSSYCRQ